MIEFIKALRIIQPVNTENSWFDTSFNMNIYRGCNQGCIYCDSRSSCYKIDNFSRIRAKENAPDKVYVELSKKRKVGIVSMGGMNDPYNMYEEELEYTRKILQHILRFKYGVFVITKMDTVTRDIDIYKKINNNNVVNVGITITTYDLELQKKIEPNCSTTSERFAALKKLSSNGIFCGVMLMPILPFINDTLENITSIVTEAHNAGVNYIYPSFGVTLRDRQRSYFYHRIGDKLAKHYDSVFGDSYVCTSPNYTELKKHFIQLCKKYGILYKMEDIIREQRNTIKIKQEALF